MNSTNTTTWSLNLYKIFISVSSPSINGVPNKPACFECADGRCINPVLPVYDEDFEKPLSFLCDGYNHCADGTDERKGIIYRKKHVMQKNNQLTFGDILSYFLILSY